MPDSVLAISTPLPSANVATAPAGAVTPQPMQPGANVIGLNPNAARQPDATPNGLAVPNVTARPVAEVIEIMASVGAGASNRTNDVKAVQQRLSDLGFEVTVDGRIGPQTKGAIQLFASIVQDKVKHHQASSKLTPNGSLTKRLFSDDAPRWVATPSSGVGFKNIDIDGYSRGTARTMAAIAEAGRQFQTYRNDHAAQPIQINDISRKDGTVKTTRSGKPEHVSHRNGLDIDVRLPRTNGAAGGTKVSYSSYDRDAAYAIIDAFCSQPNVTRVLLNDPEIKARAVREGKSWADKFVVERHHNDHFHFDIKGG